MKFYLLIAFSLLLSSATFAQGTSWKKLVNQGDDLMEAGKYLEAGKSYQMAFKMKPDKEKVASKAGAAFVRARDYKTALKMLRSISKESKDYPLAGFWYAKSLKGMGEFDKAEKAFRGFRRRYPGAKTDAVMTMAAVEIEGCEMAMEWEGIPVIEETKTLPINTLAQEFGLIPFSEDIVYYSTSEQGMSSLKRSQFSGGKWSDPVTPDFPTMPAGHFGQGAFSVDKTAFYFTICNGDKPWDSRDMTCDIYAIKRDGSSWSSPEKLRDYLKGDGTTATHPFAYSDGENEILIYSTDQSGGVGGLDLWKTTRPLNSDAFDFSFPEHLGSTVNSMGDEITPFVNMEDGTLYFSSNGLSNFGGYDIFTVALSNVESENPENAGYPLNSNADDYYFRMPTGSSIQYFTSNRSTLDWETTTDDNIFQVGAASNPLVTLVGNVKNRNSEENVEDAIIMVIETLEDGREILMTTQATNAGNFSLPLLADKSYKLEASAEGHISNEVEVSRVDLMGGENMVKDIYLMPNENAVMAAVSEVKPSNATMSTAVNSQKVLATNHLQDSVLPRRNPILATTPKTTVVTETMVDPVVNSAPVANIEVYETTTANTSTTTNNDNNWMETTLNNSAATDYTNYSTSTTSSSAASDAYTNSRFAGDGVRTSAPRHDGSYYKIQLSIVVDYNPGAPEYETIQDLGRLDTEYIIARQWTRILLADYFSKEEALRVLQEARNRGFVEAFLVRYQDGLRKI